MLRFAPTPIGNMNISSLRVALFNYMVSKQKNEDLLIRIENFNKDKNINSKSKEILEILNLFSITYKNIIYQSDNLKYHTQFAMQLLVDKKAFNCFCGENALANDKEEAKASNKPYKYSGFCENLSDEVTFACEAPFTVRLKKPSLNIKFTDTIKGDFDYKPFDIDSFVILRHDKTPTYNFACAIDDMLSDISIVIRDEYYLLNTPEQIHIRNSIGYDKKIQYIHLPVMLNLNINEKDEVLSVKWLIDEGYLPAAIANYLVLLGYNSPKEIFTIEEALKWFDISKISKSPAKFDINKLKFINKEHIKSMDELRLSKILGYSDKDIGSLAKVYIKECDTIKQLKEKIDTIFKSKTTLKDFQDEFDLLNTCIINAPYIKDFNEFKKYIIKETSIKENSLLIPLRFVLTGAISGPNLSEIYPLIRNYLGEIVK